ncbi:hypothetical protein D3C72_2026770 [compost metagenome]
MAPSIGPSALPETMDAAITMPPVRWPPRARYAPQPSSVTWVVRRVALDSAAKMMLRCWARTCALSEPAVSLPQMRTASGIMARALMICELRDIESRCALARVR